MSDRNPKSPSFVFLAHPVRCCDAPFMWLRRLSARTVVHWWWLKLLWPVWAVVSLWHLAWPKSHLRTDRYRFGEALVGHSWLVRNFAWHYLLPPLQGLVRRRINRAVLAAQEMGADVVGLGALNKAEWLNGGGERIVEDLGDQLRIPVVHGDTMTAAVVFQRAWQVIERRGLRGAPVFVTGGTSKTGRAVALALIRRGVRVKLLTGSEERFQQIRCSAGSLADLLERAQGLGQGADCPLWITGKSIPAGQELVDAVPRHGAVVNFSVPDPLPPAVLETRPDVLHLDGGVLAYDPTCTDLWFTLGLKRGVFYACHAGTMVHAHLGWKHHEVGEVDVDRMDAAWLGAAELGLRLPPPTSHHQPVSLSARRPTPVLPATPVPSRAAGLLAMLLGVCLVFLVFTDVARAAEGRQVTLLDREIELAEDEPEYRVMVSDRREPEEGGTDPALLGRVGGQEIRADGVGPREAVPLLVLDAIRNAGFTASGEESDAPLALQARLHRFWVSGEAPVTAQIDIDLVVWSTDPREKLDTRRLTAAGMSSRPLPEAVDAAVAGALASLEAQLDEAVEQIGYEPLGSDEDLDVGGWTAASQAAPRSTGARMRRTVGFGAGTRLGVEAIPDRGITEAQGEFLSFELRLVADEMFSFDWVADVIGPVATKAQRGQRYPLEIQTSFFAHFSAGAHRRVAVAIAPGLHLHVIPDSKPKWNMHILYAALRAGVDIASPGREFGMGIYLRPQVGGLVGRPDDGTRVEVYLELAWTFFAGPWQSAY
jgi:predicted amino acid dehydrogenase